MRMTAVLMSLMLVLSACADADDTVVLDESDDGTTLQASPGDVIVVELEANPSTGYSWVVPETPGLVLVDESYLDRAPDVAGSPGTTRFEFEVESAGTITMVLEYRRPWLPDEAPDRTFTITIASS